MSSHRAKRCVDWGCNLNNFSVELPAELLAEVARRSGRNPGGESAWVADAVREKLEACAELDYLESRAARGDREAFKNVLLKVPAAPPLPGDHLPGDHRPTDGR